MKEKKETLSTLKFVSIALTVIVFVASYIISLHELDLKFGESAPFAYVVGHYFGVMATYIIIPIISWVIYLIYLSEYYNRLSTQRNTILSSKEFGQEFEVKLNALNRLRSSNQITLKEFNEKTDSLKEYYFNKLMVRNNQVILDDAFSKGVITKEEYEQKGGQIEKES